MTCGNLYKATVDYAHGQFYLVLLRGAAVHYLDCLLPSASLLI